MRKYCSFHYSFINIDYFFYQLVQIVKEHVWLLSCLRAEHQSLKNPNEYIRVSF